VIAEAGLAWPFTAWFAALGIVALVGAVRARRWTERASYLAHLVMAGVMAVMPWPWAMAVPSGAWIVVFGAAAAGYVALALAGRRARAGGLRGRGHRGERLLPWYHAAMMLAMVWMAVLAGPLGEVHAGAGMNLSGGMGGMHGASLAAPTALDPAGPPVWTIAVALLLAAGFFLAAVAFLGRLRSPGAAHPARALPERVDIAFSAATALGMAAAFLVMS